MASIIRAIESKNISPRKKTSNKAKNARAVALIKEEIEKERARKEKKAAYMRAWYQRKKLKK